MSLHSYKLCFNVRKRGTAVFLHDFLSINYFSSYKTSSQESFKFADLIVNSSPENEPDFKNLKFGTTFSKHMLEIEWADSVGWGKPRILPLHQLNFHPGCKVLHYAQAVFEGMKAFKHTDDKVALFRPDMNMKRLFATSQRACLPSFDSDELLKCIKKLVSIDKCWVPNRELCSMYIRPNFIGVEDSLGVATANKALLYVVTCPVGPYFTSTIEPISLLADPEYVRACPGGVGAYKMASNYAPTLHVQKIAQKQGLDQVLWLLGKDYQITEAGAMNAFFLLKNEKEELELVTPPLDGVILPGVVRQSVLDLGRKWDEFRVTERPINMKEVIAAWKKGRLLEMFVCGTAVSVCPVKLIKFQGEDITIPISQGRKPLFNRFLKTIIDIQYGKIKSDWSVPVE